MRWSRSGLREALASISGATTDAHRAPPNLSVVIGERRDATRDRHQLYVQGQQLVAPVDDGTLLRSIVRAGAGLTASHATDTLVFNATPVIGPDRSVVLVDRAITHELRAVRSRLARDGHRVVDLPSAPVDPGTVRLRVPDAAAAWRLDRARLDAEFPPRAGDDDLGPVDAPVRRIVVAASATPGSAASAIATTAGLLRRSGSLDPLDVERLVALLDHAEIVAWAVTDPVPLAELL